CEVVRASNPNSAVEIPWYPENHPERPLFLSCIFISLKPCTDGLITICRGLIGVDSTFLKVDFVGVLLSVVALDGNNEMFPTAWGIVSGEDEETWKFFLYHLKNVLQQGRDNNWCIILDRHKAYNDFWIEVGRRYRMKHL
ncbi:Uncharacterized protein RDABS01_039429, partial [Bienertia sinuspersici]